ncbi:hypothetical protein ONZ43_g3513 [Nemania bipapillata]|uniref:Uncharacterized protein n=1 Tax=Nemania bipapillata TaxID=110536 RepID=A0ACC2IWM1_9PEZI|nr:hypothetical protein ONZ43_g3513 [Nemania bipapillata]
MQSRPGNHDSPRASEPEGAQERDGRAEGQVDDEIEDEIEDQNGPRNEARYTPQRAGQNQNQLEPQLDPEYELPVQHQSTLQVARPIQYEFQHQHQHLPRNIPVYVPDLNYSGGPAYKVEDESLARHNRAPLGLQANPSYNFNIAGGFVNNGYMMARTQSEPQLGHHHHTQTIGGNNAGTVDINEYNRVAQLLQERTARCERLERQRAQLLDERQRLMAALITSRKLER